MKRILLITCVICLLGASKCSLAQIVTFETIDAEKTLKIVVTRTPGGMAVDEYGNIYYSVQADSTHAQGRIIMLWEKYNTPIPIVDGLLSPGDIELTPDGRGLLIAEEDVSWVTVHYFGLTVQLRDPEGQYITNAVIYAETDLGTTKGYRFNYSTGYYRIPDLLVPKQVSNTIKLVIERENKQPTVVPVVLGQPGFTDKPFGETVRLIMIR